MRYLYSNHINMAVKSVLRHSLQYNYKYLYNCNCKPYHTVIVWIPSGCSITMLTWQYHNCIYNLYGDILTIFTVTAKSNLHPRFRNCMCRQLLPHRKSPPHVNISKFQVNMACIHTRNSIE